MLHPHSLDSATDQLSADFARVDVQLSIVARFDAETTGELLETRVRETQHEIVTADSSRIAVVLSPQDGQRGVVSCHLTVSAADPTEALSIAYRFYTRLREHFVELGIASPESSSPTANNEVFLEDIERQGGWRTTILTNNLATLRETLKAVTPAAIRDRPKTRLAMIFIMCKDHRLLEALREWQDFLQDVFANRYPSLPAWEVGVMKELVGGYASAPVTANRFLRLEALCDQIPGHDVVARAVIHNCLCLRALDTLQVALALRYAEVALDEFTEVGSILGQFYMLCHRGFARSHAGSFSEACHDFEKARAYARLIEVKPRELRAISEVLNSRVLYQANRIAESTTGLSEAITAIEQGEGWSVLLWTAYRLKIDLAVLEQGDVAVVAAINSTRERARARGLRRLDILIGLHEIEIDLRHGRTSTARRHANRLGLESLCKREIARDLAWREPIFYARYLALLMRLPDVQAGDTRELQDLLHQASILGLFALQVRLKLLRAQFEVELGAADIACRWIEEALAMTLVERPVRIILDHPHSLSLLRWYRSQSRSGRRVRSLWQFASELEALAGLEARQVHAGEHRIMVTARQMECLNALAGGLRNKEIAQQLGRTENTVKFHIKRLNSKLGASRRRDLLVKARDAGLLA